MSELLFEVTSRDYLNSPYREALFTWLRSLVVDTHDMRRVRVYKVEHGYEVRIDEYVRDEHGALVLTDTKPPTVVTRERVIPFNDRSWPRRELHSGHIPDPDAITVHLDVDECIRPLRLGLAECIRRDPEHLAAAHSDEGDP